MARPSLQWLAINVGYLSVMTFAGVNVAVGYWPQPLQDLAVVLPLTHGLEALRALLDGGPAATTALGVVGELAVAAGWLVVTVGLLRFAVAKGRRTGSLELSAG
jgi:ABC-2 type transport system permease protein